MGDGVNDYFKRNGSHLIYYSFQHTSTSAWIYWQLCQTDTLINNGKWISKCRAQYFQRMPFQHLLFFNFIEYLKERIISVEIHELSDLFQSIEDLSGSFKRPLHNTSFKQLALFVVIHFKMLRPPSSQKISLYGGKGLPKLDNFLKFQWHFV